MERSSIMMFLIVVLTLLKKNQSIVVGWFAVQRHVWSNVLVVKVVFDFKGLDHIITWPAVGKIDHIETGFFLSRLICRTWYHFCCMFS